MPRLESRFGDQPRLSENPPVGFLLDEARHLGAPFTLVVAQKANGPLPPLDVRLSRSQFRTGGGGGTTYQFKSVVLRDGQLVALFEENIGVQQKTAQRKEYTIPVSTQQVPAASLLDVIGPKLHSARLSKLAGDEERLARLNRTYGEVNLDSALTMSGNRMLEGFQDVEIVGFKFSPRYFWIFTLTFTLVIP